MLKVLGCVTAEHDLRLVGLAAIVALIGSYTSFGLLRHVPLQAGRSRWVWLAGAACTFGLAIWSTHVIAMLAFAPGFATGYAPALMAISLVAAILITGGGFAAATAATGVVARLQAGVLVGTGITVMHYTGMAGLAVPGHLSWDISPVVLSMLLGCAMAASAICVALPDRGRGSQFCAALLLAAAICADHFCGMAAVSVVLGETRDLPSDVLSPQAMAAAVTVAGLVLLGLAVACVELDRRIRRHKSEARNLQVLADIAAEGVLVCDGAAVVTVNRSFQAMSGHTPESVRGAALASLFAGEAAAPVAGSILPAERTLVHANGDLIPVEMVRRQILFSGRPLTVVSLRDLKERQGVEKKIRFLAHHDPLTGLANRAFFGDHLNQHCLDLAGGAHPFAVLMIDLDRFKVVNDTQGHPFGDALLIAVAERLRGAVREGDLVARIGGDEFAVLLNGSAGAESVASRIVDVVGRPYTIEGKTVDIGASVGLALAPEDGDSPTQLMGNADMALYTAKGQGRNCYVFFERAMGAKVQSRHKLKADLRHAMSRGEFKVFYQPQLSYERNRIISFEALLRWQHPERGLLLPASFLALAEEAGLLVSIGNWVLQQATAQAAAWGNGIGVAVNLAAAQFAGDGPVATVHAALAASGLAPHLLELEITEGALITGGQKAVGMLRDIRALGVKVSIDNFGAGHSFLTHLRSFTFDRIKIDRSFVSAAEGDKGSMAMIQGIVSLGRSLGVTMAAEGVETAEQMSRMRLQGCDSAQGYMIGRPMPADEATKLLAPKPMPVRRPGMRLVQDRNSAVA